MIRRIKKDTILSKHWLGIRYFLHVDDNVIASKELISQYLFQKDLLDIGISFYDIEEQGHAYYDIQHNKMLYSPNLKQLLHLMKTKEVLTDIYEQAAKMISLFVLLAAVFTHRWMEVFGWFCMIFMFRQFKYTDLFLLVGFASLIAMKAPILIPVLIMNTIYISKIRGDYIYDLFVCHSGRRRR